tara:strand:+ start:151 stop:324 length:174 start_codon:yes stop_codon:yes gene_type:complete
MNNLTNLKLNHDMKTTLAQGFKLATTPGQVKKVQAYEKEIKERLARMNKMLGEILKR